MIHEDAFSDATAAFPKVSALRRSIVNSALQALDEAGYIVVPKHRAVVTRDAGEYPDLPAPRLQLRWEEENAADSDKERSGTWLCHYEMVIPLSRLDIRRERDDGTATDEDGNIKGSCFMALPMGLTRIYPMKSPMESDRNGEQVLREPFRDSMHASWDSQRLGMPAFVVWREHRKEIEPSVPLSERAAERPPTF